MICLSFPFHLSHMISSLSYRWFSSSQILWWNWRKWFMRSTHLRECTTLPISHSGGWNRWLRSYSIIILCKIAQDFMILDSTFLSLNRAKPRTIASYWKIPNVHSTTFLAVALAWDCLLPWGWELAWQTKSIVGIYISHPQGVSHGIHVPICISTSGTSPQPKIANSCDRLAH
jgi:hypothetical protein